ncbi:TIGR04222 domain-containing membrane protein [Lentzea sp. NPDC058450]|uniref:TIGR04222 domain-containing membrane protein n=1 Tax=Lentzea sp. NPDC058450 TaxID=3346505 RepID=UPI003669991E
MAVPTAARRTDVSAEEIGFLTAGPGRAAETALARLLDGGIVRVSRDGLVSAVHQNGHGATTDVETHIHNQVRSKSVRIGQVVRNAADSVKMDALQRELRRRRLTRSARPRLGAWWVFLVIGLVMALAAITQPWLLIGTAGFLGTAWYSFGAKPLTRAGRAALAGVTASDRVLAVALEGFRGTISGRPVGALFGMSQAVTNMVPRKKKRRRNARGGGAGAASSAASCGSCGSGCGSSSCGSSSCSSSSSSCSSSSGSSCGGGGSSCGGGGGGD